MFAYVVLHYMSEEMTVDCVNHILRLSDDSRVVIVDNFSPNGSGEKLSTYFQENPRVYVIINTKNEGFAKGNNLGYKFAIENFDPDYIVVSNNDVLISQHNFEAKMTSFMKKKRIDVAGPDILTPDDYHQNPLAYNTLSTKVLEKTIFFNKLKLALFSIPIFFDLYAKFRRKHKVIVGSESISGDVFDCILHGSFVVFGRKYFKNETFAFLPITNMYGEEYILYDYLKIKGYQTGVCSEAQILHIGGKSTSQQWGDLERTKFRFKNTTNSLTILLKLRKQYLEDGNLFKE